MKKKKKTVHCWKDSLHIRGEMKAALTFQGRKREMTREWWR